MFKKTLSFLFLISFTLNLGAISFDSVEELCPDCYTVPGFSDDQEIMICCHGFGMDAEILDFLESQEFAPHHLVAFDFPNCGHGVNDQPADELVFGTIWELEPLLKTWKQCVIEGGQEAVHLYGFSAGGGAVVNALAVLWHYRFAEQLEEFGITVDIRDQMIEAVRKGTVVLDLPLKSVEEVVVVNPEEATENLLTAANNYVINDLKPIDSVCKLEGMNLNILLHFQHKDRILSNRDDALFCERLLKANKGGITHIITGREGIHAPCTPSIIEAYQKCFSKYFEETDC